MKCSFKKKTYSTKIHFKQFNGFFSRLKRKLFVSQQKGIYIGDVSKLGQTNFKLNTFTYTLQDHISRTFCLRTVKD